MGDLAWLSTEAQKIHLIFNNVFFSIVTLLLILGVILQYFNLPLGELPSFGVLVGRAFIAVILLVSFQDVMNMVADVTDALAKQLGDLNQFKLVSARMGEAWESLSFDLLSIKKTFLMLISFGAFFVLYISVYFADALFLYSWTLLYVFSPLLIALYVLPQTASATSGLYRSILEVAAWKIVWSVLATLLWSAALIDLERLLDKEMYLTIVIFNFMLAVSLLLTPVIVRALIGKGVHSVATKIGGAGIAAGTMLAGKIAGSTIIRKATNQSLTQVKGSKELFQKKVSGIAQKSRNQMIQYKKSQNKKG